MLFSDIVGQSKLKHDLKSMVDQEKFPHALMFIGQEGWGTLPLALAFVQYVMCQQRQDEACGTCDNCIKLQKFEHPDVRASYPTIIPKANTKNLSVNFIDEFRSFIQQTPYGSTYDWMHMINTDGKKQGNISADECREIVEGMNLKSYEGGYKIHIIWRPEYLDKEGNRLLKLIEEPPANTLLIFVATEEKRILPTLLSRMQAFKLMPISIEEMKHALVEKKNIAADKALQIANIADGSYSAALNQLQDFVNESLPLITQLLNAVYANNGMAMHEWVDKMAEMSKEGINQFMQYMQVLFNAGFRKSVQPKVMLHLSEEDATFVQKLANLNLPLDSFQYIDQGINQVTFHIGRNANVKVQLLHFAIQMQYWIKGRKLSVV